MSNLLQKAGSRDLTWTGSFIARLQRSFRWLRFSREVSTWRCSHQNQWGARGARHPLLSTALCFQLKQIHQRVADQTSCILKLTAFIWAWPTKVPPVARRGKCHKRYLVRKSLMQEADLLWFLKPVVALIIASMKEHHYELHALRLLSRPVDECLYSLKLELLHRYWLVTCSSTQGTNGNETREESTMAGCHVAQPVLEKHICTEQKGYESNVNHTFVFIIT